MAVCLLLFVLDNIAYWDRGFRNSVLGRARDLGHMGRAFRSRRMAVSWRVVRSLEDVLHRQRASVFRRKLRYKQPNTSWPSETRVRVQRPEETCGAGRPARPRGIRRQDAHLGQGVDRRGRGRRGGLGQAGFESGGEGCAGGLSGRPFDIVDVAVLLHVLLALLALLACTRAGPRQSRRRGSLAKCCRGLRGGGRGRARGC